MCITKLLTNKEERTKISIFLTGLCKHLKQGKLLPSTEGRIARKDPSDRNGRCPRGFML
jgi:hypothetical protein